MAIHGDISQGQRTGAVESFKSGTVPLLVATDVAARGLDIPDVEAVINYRCAGGTANRANLTSCALGA